MLNLLRKHKVYEVWNEWAAESAFIDHKPVKVEVMELVEKNHWYPGEWRKDATSRVAFIKRYIHVKRLKPFYTKS